MADARFTPQPWGNIHVDLYSTYSMKTITHHGRETAYRRTDRGGNGPVVLFVHGSGATGDLWRGQRSLAERCEVVALDLSGHGESEDVDVSAGYETLAAYATDVVAVARDVGADILVGNSLGGAVVLHVALERGYDPSALVLAGTGAKLAVLDDLLGWLDDDFERAVEFLHADGRLFYDPDETLRTASADAMRSVGQEITRRDFRTCHAFDVRERIGEIETPTLAVYGEHDQLTPPRYHEYLVDELPDAARASIDDAAHLAMLERPAAFNAALERFLDELAANGSV